MSTILRASQRNSGAQGVPFNFDDMATQANLYLEKVRAEAGKTVLKAEQDAQAIRKRAELEGQQAATQAAKQAAEGAVEKQLASALPALRQVVQDIQHAKQAWLKHWEMSGVAVATAIAQRLIRRELSQPTDIAVGLVREALELAAGSSQLRIHMNPDDHQALAAQVKMLVSELAGLADTELIADPEITRGGCRVETRFGSIDQQFEAQLKRIEEELTC
jgi:flagellar assembly protein FliH